jgi:hypothetical protein
MHDRIQTAETAISNRNVGIIRATVLIKQKAVLNLAQPRCKSNRKPRLITRHECMCSMPPHGACILAEQQPCPHLHASPPHNRCKCWYIRAAEFAAHVLTSFFPIRRLQARAQRLASLKMSRSMHHDRYLFIFVSLAARVFLSCATLSLSAIIHTCARASICACVHSRLCACVCASGHVSVRAYVRVCMCVCVCVCVCATL